MEQKKSGVLDFLPDELASNCRDDYCNTPVPFADCTMSYGTWSIVYLWTINNNFNGDARLFLMLLIQ
jgi:hypothetical protein